MTYYVLMEDGIFGEYDSLEEAETVCDKFNSRGEDAWICTDDECEEDDRFYEDYDSDFGYDPYLGCCTYDC